jgi:hypothetical protein
LWLADIFALGQCYDAMLRRPRRDRHPQQQPRHHAEENNKEIAAVIAKRLDQAVPAKE